MIQKAKNMYKPKEENVKKLEAFLNKIAQNKEIKKQLDSK
jgi:hypothetical protein